MQRLSTLKFFRHFSTLAFIRMNKKTADLVLAKSNHVAKS